MTVPEKRKKKASTRPDTTRRDAHYARVVSAGRETMKAREIKCLPTYVAKENPKVCNACFKVARQPLV